MKTNSSPLFYSEEREENVLSEKKKGKKLTKSEAD